MFLYRILWLIDYVWKISRLNIPWFIIILMIRHYLVADLNLAAFPGVKRMFAHVATGSIYSVEQTQLLRDAIKHSSIKYRNIVECDGCFG